MVVAVFRGSVDIRFKYGLRVCKTKHSIIADNIAEKMCKKNDRTF